MTSFKCALEEGGRGKGRCEAQCESCRGWWPPKEPPEGITIPSWVCGTVILERRWATAMARGEDG